MVQAAGYLLAGGDGCVITLCSAGYLWAGGGGGCVITLYGAGYLLARGGDGCY